VIWIAENLATALQDTTLAMVTTPAQTDSFHNLRNRHIARRQHNKLQLHMVTDFLIRITTNQTVRQIHFMAIITVIMAGNIGKLASHD